MTYVIMKSYLRFLSRNKLYTAIEIVGLSVALAFVIVLSSYIVDDMSVNSLLKNRDEIYLCHPEGDMLHPVDNLNFYEGVAEIEAACSYTSSGDRKSIIDEIATLSYQGNECAVGAMMVDKTFFDIFTLPLVEGDSATALQIENSVIISEEVMNTLFPEGDVLGKTVRLFELNPLKRWYGDIDMDLDLELTITGVFNPYENTIFHQNELILRQDFMTKTISEITMGMLVFPCANFIKLHPDANPEEVAAKLTVNFNASQDSYKSMYPGVTSMVLTPFDDIRTSNFDETYYFTNLRPVKLFNIYLLMCIFITIVSLLDYIVLTIAFSRFRIKEIATRQLLGTSRKGVMLRCFAEALVLILVSCLFAVLLALGFKDAVGQILGTEIRPLTQMGEYILLSGIILMMVAAASAVPAFLLSSYKPINIIKGEVRFREKKSAGRIFLSFAGFLCIASLSICLGIVRQTKHLLNQPLGYDTDNIIYVNFQGDKINRYLDELESLPFVTEIGAFEHLPTNGIMLVINDAQNQTHQLSITGGNKKYFEILGIDILEGEEPHENPYEYAVYVCKGSSDIIPYIREAESVNGLASGYKLKGISEDYKAGQLNYDNTGRATAIAIVNSPGNEPIMKVNIDEDEAIRKVEEFYRSKGYDEAFFEVSSLSQTLAEETKEETNMLKLILGFTTICLMMTATSIVGLSSYRGKINERDNAVRNVFGCPKNVMIRRIMMDFVLPVTISAVAAVPLAYAVIERWLEGYLFRCTNSPAIYVSAIAIVVVVTVASVSLQALRLMRTNPAGALKKE